MNLYRQWPQSSSAFTPYWNPEAPLIPMMMRGVMVFALIRSPAGNVLHQPL